MTSSPLEFEDLSQTCRRDRFCQFCVQAFCSHCCRSHHTRGPFHSVIPVDVDAATGRPVFTTSFEFDPSQQSLRDLVVGTIAAQDYTTRLPRDSYCAPCKRVFCAGACPHHHDKCGPDAVLRIEEHAGTGAHCVRYTGTEPWFRRVEGYLGDPVAEGEDEHGQYYMLLPVLKRARDKCVHCGGQVRCESHQHCSARCGTAYRQEVAQRKERREAKLAARELAKLQIY